MDIELIDHQWLSLTEEEAKFILLLGGIGSGKTFTGAHYAIKNITNYPDALGFICANTYDQLTTATLACLFEELERAEIWFKYNQQKKIITLHNTEVLCKSLDKYQNIRGIEIGWGWGDEIAFAKEDAFKVISGRLRDRNGPLQMLFTTSPFGYGWLYDYFHPSGDKHTSEYKMFNARTENNVFLPDGYSKSLRSQYSEKMALQELDGEFVNLTSGLIYYAFNRKKHVVDVEITGAPLHIGMDFNVNPMTATVAEIHGTTLHIIDEIYLPDSNTPEMIENIIAKYGRGGITINPDDTGKNRSSKTSATDHTLLKKEFTVMTARNPFRVDRYNCVNVLLEAGRIKINPRCKKLIKDLERVGYKEGTSLMDTSDKSLGHITDALGYTCWRNFPLKRKFEPIQIIAH